MPSFVFNMSVPVNPRLVGYIEKASCHRPPGPMAGTDAAAKATVSMALPFLRAALPSGEVALDVFVWDLILGELARFYKATGQEDSQLLWEFSETRRAMHADERYVALLLHAKEHDKKERRVARAKKRYERDRKIVNAYATTGNAVLALEAGKN